MPKGMPGDYPPKKNVVKDFAELGEALSIRKEEEEEAGGASERERRRRSRRSKKPASEGSEPVSEEEVDPSIDKLLTGVSSYMEQEVAAKQHAARLEAAKERLFAQKDERENRRIQEVRARLSELEGLATRKDVESEAVALERELRDLEAKHAASTEKEPETVPVSFDTPKEGREALKAAVMDVISLPDQSNAGVSYEGKPNYQVPAVVEAGALSEEPSYPVPAVVLTETAKVGAPKSPEVLAAEEVMGQLETKLREQTTKFYSKKNRLFRHGWDDLKKTERAYDRAVYELASARKAEGLNGLEIVRDVMRKGEAVKFEARKQALAVDQRYALEKALGLIPKGNAWLEKQLGKNGARTLKAFATAAVVTGVTASAGSIGIGLLLAGGAIKFGQSLGIAAASATGVVAAGNWFDKVFGKKGQDKAKEQLETVAAEEHFTKESFERTRAKLAKLIVESDDQTRERNRLMAQAVAAFGIGGAGAGMGALMSLLDLNMPFTGSSVDEKVTGTATSMPEQAPVATPAAPVEAPLAKVPPAPEPSPATVAEVPAQEAQVPASSAPSETVPAPSSTVPESVPQAAEPSAGPSQIESSAQEPEAVAVLGDEEAITRELNRQALEGRPTAPISQEALDSSTPYLAAQEAAPAPSPAVAAAEIPKPEVVTVEPVPVAQNVAEAVPVVDVSSPPEPAYEAPAPVVQEVAPQQPEPVSVQSESPRAAPIPVQEVQPPSAPAVGESSVGESAPAPAEAAPSANINAHGVDLDTPGVALADGKYFAHGGVDNDANYELAIQFAKQIAETQPPAPVYYVEEHMTVLGGLERTVRAVIFDPLSNRGMGMVVPYAVENGTPVTMPGIPDPTDYQPLPTQR